MNWIGNLHTDIGIKKKVNQDACCLLTKRVDGKKVIIAAVADGMGGFESGERASSSIITRVSNWFDNLTELKSFENMEIVFRKIISNQNLEIKHSNGIDELIGTTLVLFFAIENRYLVANIGDSRAYKIDDKLELITRDHTWVNEQVQSGKISISESLNHPKKHVLTQCIGIRDEIKIDFYRDEFTKDTVFMICSDGFRNKLSNAEIYEAFSPEKISSIKDSKIQAYRMVEICKERKETDNITSIVIKGIFDKQSKFKSIYIREVFDNIVLGKDEK